MSLLGRLIRSDESALHTTGAYFASSTLRRAPFPFRYLDDHTLSA